MKIYMFIYINIYIYIYVYLYTHIYTYTYKSCTWHDLTLMMLVCTLHACNLWKYLPARLKIVEKFLVQESQSNWYWFCCLQEVLAYLQMWKQDDGERTNDRGGRYGKVAGKETNERETYSDDSIWKRSINKCNLCKQLVLNFERMQLL